MRVTVTGWLSDFRPLVRCRITPAGAPYGPTLGTEFIALVDTGATDCTMRPTTQVSLGLPITEHAHTTNIGVAGLKPATRIDVTLVGTKGDGQNGAWTALGARTFIDDFDPVAQIILGMNVLRLLPEFGIRHGVPFLITPT